MSNLIHESVNGISLIALEDIQLREGKINFTGAVSSETCNQLITQLLYLASNPDIKEIKFFINSPGGSVNDGLVIYDTIRMIDAIKPVKTIVCGLAASMGSILFLSGSTRSMLPHSKLMLHDPSFSNNNIAGKKPHEIQAELDDLKSCQKLLVKLIAERSGIPEKEVYKITAKDSYFSAEEALKKGFATNIITNIKEVL